MMGVMAERVETEQAAVRPTRVVEEAELVALMEMVWWAPLVRQEPEEMVETETTLWEE